MAKSSSLRVGDIKLAAGGFADSASVDPETPFRILLLGDFSGQGRKGGQPSLAQRKPARVDRDNLGEVLARVGAAVRAPLGPNPQEQVAIAFQSIEDFEPDQLFQRLSVFESLRNLRRRLQDSAQFEAAAAEIKGWPSAAKIADPPVPAAPPVSQEAPVSENILEQILAEQGTLPAQPARGETDWSRFLNAIVEPYLKSSTPPRRPEFEALVDEAVSAQMRTLLHHADFQAVEAAWRGLEFLVSRLDTDAKLQLFMLDAAKEELANDLIGVADLGPTGTCKHLVERTVGTPGAQPWAVVVGLYTFGPGTQDVELLANLAKITSRAGAPFLAAAQSLVLGCASLDGNTDPRGWPEKPAGRELWQQLRKLPEATYLGLALPRFLLRSPYGKEFTTTEQFAFEEMPPGTSHENYLWGNPALACALLLGQSFSQSGWNLRPGEVSEIDRLPVHLYEEDGERVAKPCAEVLLTTDATERILDAGLVPLLSLQGEPAIRLARFQSVASSGAPLAGRWQ